MMEGLSSITTQTCCPLCGNKKLDDSKKISILKKNRDQKVKKLWKQDRDQETSWRMETSKEILQFKKSSDLLHIP